MAFVTDLAVNDRATATYAPLQFGRHRFETPEGYVLWQGVRLARIGTMLYKAEDFPGYEADPNGWIVAERDEEVLFHPDTMLSFNGKSMTNEHPPSMLDLDNTAEYEVGLGFNIRRGEGLDAGYLVGDLLVKDADTIDDIDKGKREISLGSDVDAEQVKPGYVRITKIVGNHIALVKRGRAGPSCAILDKENTMATRKKRSFVDRLRTAFKANDEAAFEEELESMDEGEGDQPQRVVIELKTPEAAPAENVGDEGAAGGEGGGEADPYAERFASIEGALTKLADAVAALSSGGNTAQVGDEDDGNKDEPGGVNDEGDDDEGETTKVAAMDAMSKAEILAPGIKMPKFDSATGSAAPIVALKRQALKAALAGKHKDVITTVLGGQPADFDTMKTPVLTVVFDSAAALVGAHNNAGARTAPVTKQGGMTAAKLQELNASRRTKH